MIEFSDVRSYADEIKAGYGQRNALFDKIEDAYLLKQVELPNFDWIKATLSPDARNKTLGAARLLTAADPKWTVPRDKNKSELDEGVASKVEKAAAMMWAASGKIRRKPVHYKAVMTALLYGQVDIAISTIDGLIEGEKSDVRKRKIERAGQRTPLIFEALNSRLCYPVFDLFGLTAHYTYRKMRVVDIISRFGSNAESLLTGKKRTEELDYSEFWNDEIHSVWVDGVKDALLHEEHGLSTIPIASAVIEGGDIFDDEYAWQPFLYTLIQSGIHARQSLMLTLMYSNAFATGALPINVFKTDDPNNTLDIDYSNPGGVIVIKNNEDISPLKRDVIDQSMRELLSVAEGKADESTLYGQTLGEPLGANAPFSMVSLLSQSGRLPLLPYQRMLSSVLTDAMGIGLTMLREQGSKDLAVGPAGTGIELNLDDVPEDLELVATLDIDLPQDKIQDARVAMELSGKKLLSKERVRERYLNVDQSDDEEKQILHEGIRDSMMQMQIQVEMMKMQQQLQQQMQQMQMQLQGGQGMPPGMPMQAQPGMEQQGMQTPPGMPGQEQPQEQPIPRTGASEGMPLQEPVTPQGEQPMPEDLMNQLGGA